MTIRSLDAGGGTGTEPDADTTRVELGEKITDVTESLCSSVWRHCPLLASQILTV